MRFYCYPFVTDEDNKHRDNAEFPAENPSEFQHRSQPTLLISTRFSFLEYWENILYAPNWDDSHSILRN